MLFERQSLFTGKVHKLDLPITEAEWDHYLHSGSLIQDAFPKLTPDQREFLMTGITKEEWEMVFPPKEDRIHQV